MSKLCLDTGVLSIYFSKSPTREVLSLIKGIQQGTIEAHILSPVLIEEFKHLCRLKGLNCAKTTLESFISQVPVKLINLSMPLLIKAGTLKCQYSVQLSYIDCMCIAYSLQTGIPFHTTEKTLKKIPGDTLRKLKVVKYKF
jgi:PIN domain nuclease of toxin-antitoxin system